MPRFSPSLRCLSAALLCGAGFAAQADTVADTGASAAPALAVTAVSTPPVIDGVLDEAAWRSAPVIELSQQNPKPGAPTPYTTEVRVLRDGSHLYLGITCTDPDPSKVSLHTLQLDGDQSNDDAVTIVLDTFDQRKLAYVFQVNAGGAMADGLLSPASAATSSGGSGQNGVVNYSWNGYWRAAVTRNDQGWTAEIAIDTQSLQFAVDGDTWGFNVARYVPRAQQTLAWSGITLNASVYNMQWEGSLTGLSGLQQGLGLEFDPYALARYDSHDPGLGSKAGFDVKYNFTPEMAGLFTYHSDFSEAPPPNQQVNFTPFALFVPEHRSFFLNGANIYDFSHNLSQYFLPFDSQKIGIVGGSVVPLNEGVKLIGTAGPWTVGVLDTQMGSSGVSDASNLFAGRLSYNVDDQWRVGTLVTHGDPAGLTDNTFTGVDSTWSSSSFAGDKNLDLSGWAARSNSDGPMGTGVGTGGGYGFDAEYPNDLWNADFRYDYFGATLDPALGFLPRPGTKLYYAQLNYQPRPDADGSFGWARQFLYDSNFTMFTDLNGRVQTETYNVFPFGFVTQGGWGLQTQVQSEYDYVAAPFNIAPNSVVPAGSYRQPNWLLTGNTPFSNLVWFQFFYNQGVLYDAKFRFWNMQLFATDPGARFTVSLTQTGLLFYQQPGKFVELIDGATLGYSFTPDFGISSLVQYNTFQKQTGANTRLQWRIEPGSYLYVVWNHDISAEADVNSGLQTSSGNQLIVKLAWAFY